MKQETMITDFSKFKHKYSGKVQFSEVDSFGVAHNLKYPYWLEWARTDYLSKIGININPMTYLREFPIMTVHSEIDYYNPCRFYDDYCVYTRISKLGNSSITFENIITDSNSKLLVKASSVLVNVDPRTAESLKINDRIRDLIIKFEGYDLELTNIDNQTKQENG